MHVILPRLLCLSKDKQCSPAIGWGKCVAQIPDIRVIMSHPNWWDDDNNMAASSRIGCVCVCVTGRQQESGVESEERKNTIFYIYTRNSH